MGGHQHATPAAPARGGRRHRRSEGTALAGFADLREIGRGGCSVVYQAREVGTGRDVALKVIDVAGVSPHAVESFQREALALAALGDHPHIVTLYRSLVLDDDRPALVLELCTGSLDARVRTGGPLTAREATAIGVKLAGALETAHRAGLLHLDVKPANVLVTQYGEPALADFGVARLQATGAGAEIAGMTTVHAAPEMLEGGAATPASDAYQLASTLYHLLAGRAAFRAFEGERPAAVALRVLQDPVEPLVGPDVPGALSDLLQWAMTKDPAGRPASMALFADALRSVEVDCGWPPTVAVVPGGRMPWPSRPGRETTLAAAWAPGVPAVGLGETSPAPSASASASAPPSAPSTPPPAAPPSAPPSAPSTPPPAAAPVKASAPSATPPVPPVHAHGPPGTPAASPVQHWPLGDRLPAPGEDGWFGAQDTEDTVLRSTGRTASGLEAIAPGEAAGKRNRRRKRRERS